MSWYPDVLDLGGHVSNLCHLNKIQTTKDQHKSFPHTHTYTQCMCVSGCCPIWLSIKRFSTTSPWKSVLSNFCLSALWIVSFTVLVSGFWLAAVNSPIWLFVCLPVLNTNIYLYLHLYICIYLYIGEQKQRHKRTVENYWR